MASSKALLSRPDIWKPDLAGRLARLHSAAHDAETAYPEVESRDAAHQRRIARRAGRLSATFPAVRR
jgi:hypothetical protein